MSPVAPSRQRSPRTIILGIAGLAVGLVLLVVVFVFAVPSLSESGKVQVKLGSDRFDAGQASKRADAVRRDGPILFSDVASGQHDIFLQHLGDDDTTGWLAFDARQAGTSRNCTLKWDSGDQQFNDPCDGTVVPADGSGLAQYKVVVTEAGTVVINLNPDDQGGDPTTTSSTTTTLLVTGTLPDR
jgi:hypothetical protein